MSVDVLIADDHPGFLSGIRSALADTEFTVCAEAADGPAAVEAAQRLRPDVCLLDVSMPGGGIAAARTICASVPGTRVVMMTISSADEDLFEAVRAGASGYLLKDTDPKRLPDALRGVLSGEAAIPRTLVARMMNELRAGEEASPRRPRSGQGGALTDREWEVLERMREGLSTSEIAERLEIAPVTVRRHVSAILSKLQANDRTEAISLIDRRGRHR